MDIDKDLIIIGGGPAGLTAAQYGARANLKTMIIEETAVGGQTLNITELENFPGFPQPISGADLSENMRQQAENFGASIIDTSVSEIKKEGAVFFIKTSEKTYTSYAVILATGTKHRKLGIPGEEEFIGRGISYCAACDGFFFKNKKIIVVGGGDTACAEALSLANISDKIIMIHRKPKFRAQKALADRVAANKNIEVRFNTICTEIKGNQKVEKAVLEETGGRKYEEETDAVFVFTGILPQNRLAENLKKDDNGYIITNEKMETSVQGFFAAGDVRATPFRQIITACGEGAIAAHYAGILIDTIKEDAYL